MTKACNVGGSQPKSFKGGVFQKFWIYWQNHDDVIKWKHFPRYWPLETGEFPAQRPLTQSFDVFFDLCLNKWLSKQPWGWWFETLSWSLSRHCNDFIDTNLVISRSNITRYWKHLRATYGVVFSEFFGEKIPRDNYNDVIMGAIASQITSLTIVVSRKLRVTGLCAENSPVTDEFPAQMASNAENVSIWWRHHVLRVYCSRKMKMKTSFFFNRNYRYVRNPGNSFVHYFCNSLYREINQYFSPCDEINTRYNEIKTHYNKKQAIAF